ncbi:MAG: type IV toxin-antitoxin system AbiEi family antitoxin, partial [Elusimicrobiota bacterium]
TGLRGTIAVGGGGADARAGHCAPGAMVTFTGGNKKYRYAVEIKTVDRPATLGVIQNKFEGYTLPGLLAAPYITAEMAEHCRTNNIQFIDTAGNAYLKAEGLHVFIAGQKRTLQNTPAAKYRANTTAGMKVVFALLCRPALLNAPYREIARAAGVALGIVGGVFYGLTERGQIVGDVRKLPRRFVDAGRLVEEWVINYPVRLRPKLAARRFAAPDVNWWGKAQPEAGTALWGGEVAVEMLTQYRKPGTGVLYLQGDPTKLVIARRLKADPKGNVEIVDKFWDFEAATDKQHVVPPLLVYADLMATGDPRNYEAAKLVYGRYIANAYD